MADNRGFNEMLFENIEFIKNFQQNILYRKLWQNVPFPKKNYGPSVQNFFAMPSQKIFRIDKHRTRIPA